MEGSLARTRRGPRPAGATRAARLLTGALVLTAACAGLSRESAAAPPNVILILVDDLGIDCLSAYGGTSYATPNIDALAAGGMRFEYAYCTPVCTPTRVELLTGLYPFRTGWDVGEWQKPAGERMLDPELPSIARVMKAAGYATAVAGKWQLARFHEAPDHPARLGFDEHCLWTYHLADQGPVDPRYWKPSIWRDGALDEGAARDDVYGPDVFLDFLVDFLERHRDEPFFAFYPMVLVHRPYLATPATVTDVESPVDESPEKRVEELGRFAENVEYMDAIVGRLMSALDRLGLRDDTLVLLSGDNGTDARITSRMGTLEVQGGKTKMNELGAAVPLIASWPGTVPAGTVCTDLVDFTDFMPTVAELAGVASPDGDGRSIVAQMLGERGDPRPWVYVQLEGHWYVRDRSWRLHDDGRLFDLHDRLREERITSARDTPSSRDARRRLTIAARELLLGEGR